MCAAATLDVARLTVNWKGALAAVVAAVGLVCAVPASAAKTVYVNGAAGSSSYDGTSPTYVSGSKGPVATLYQAYGKLGAGDSMCVMNTAAYGHFSIINYTSNSNFGTTTDTTSFAGTNPVRIRGCDGNGNFITFSGKDGDTPSATRPILYQDSGSTITIQIKGNNTKANGVHPLYTSIEGLTVTAQSSGTTGSCDNNNKTAFGIETSSHVSLKNNWIFCAGGNGVDTDGSDMIEIKNNLVTDNAHATDGGGFSVFGSGISILRPYDWQAVTGLDTSYTVSASNPTTWPAGTKVPTYATFSIVGNRFWHNFNDPSTCHDHGYTGTCNDTDGSNVIFDRTDGSCEGDLGPCDSEFGSPSVKDLNGNYGHAGIAWNTTNSLPHYTGWFEMSDNYTYGSGASGIHVYLANGKFVFRNNSTWHNNFETANVGTSQGEINFLDYYPLGGATATITNNVMEPSGVTNGANGKGPNPCFAMRSDGNYPTNSNVAAGGSATDGANVVTYANNICYPDANTTNAAYQYKFFSLKSNPAVTGIVNSKPGYTNATDTINADLSVPTTSPADDNAAVSGYYYPTDISGVTRSTTSPTWGAYEAVDSGSGEVDASATAGLGSVYVTGKQPTVSNGTASVTAGVGRLALNGFTASSSITQAPLPCNTANSCTTNSGVGPFNTADYVVSYGPVALDTGSANSGTYASGNAADVCVPTTATGATWAGPYPVVIIVHGGGWNSGYRGYDKYECDQWASIGVVAMNIDYRLEQNLTSAGGYPKSTNVWPAPFVDTQLALRWLCDNAGSYKADCTHIIGKGDSAGGSLVMQLAFYPGIYPSAGDPAVSLHTGQTANLTAVVDEFGPALTSTPNNSGNVPIVYNLLQQYGASQVDAFMGVNGDGDTSVPRVSTDTVYLACKQQGVRICRRVIYTGTAANTKGGHEFTPSNAITPSQATIRAWELQFAADYLQSVGYANVNRVADSSN